MYTIHLRAMLRYWHCKLLRYSTFEVGITEYRSYMVTVHSVCATGFFIWSFSTPGHTFHVGLYSYKPWFVMLYNFEIRRLCIWSKFDLSNFLSSSLFFLYSLKFFSYRILHATEAFLILLFSITTTSETCVSEKNYLV